LLAPERLKQRGLFNPTFVQKLLAEHEQGKANHYKTLWTLIVFELWMENFG
jgi:asparagine synthase (glutamine-hydrolysing)